MNENMAHLEKYALDIYYKYIKKIHLNYDFPEKSSIRNNSNTPNS